MTRRKRCPECGHVAVVPIVYGFPGGSMFEQAERGEIVLGGCTLLPDNPNYQCVDCNWSGDLRKPRPSLDVDLR